MLRQVYFNEISEAIKCPVPFSIQNLLPEKGVNCPNKKNEGLHLVRMFMYLNSIIAKQGQGDIKNSTITMALKFGAEMIANEILEMKGNRKNISTLKGVFGIDSSTHLLYRNKRSKYSLKEEALLTHQFPSDIKKWLEIPTFIENISDNQTVCESEFDDTVVSLQIMNSKKKNDGLSPSDLEGLATAITEIDLKMNYDYKNSDFKTIKNDIRNYTNQEDVIEADGDDLFSKIGKNNVFNVVDIALGNHKMNLPFIGELITNRINECKIGKMFVCQVPVSLTKKYKSSHFVCITKTEDNEITIWDPLTEECANETSYINVQNIINLLEKSFTIAKSYGLQSILDASSCGVNCVNHYKEFIQFSGKQDEDEPSGINIEKQNREILEQNNSKNPLKEMADYNKKHKRYLSVDENLKKKSTEENKKAGTNRHHPDSSVIKSSNNIETIEVRRGKGKSTQREITAKKGDESFSLIDKHPNLKKFKKSAGESLKKKE